MINGSTPQQIKKSPELTEATQAHGDGLQRTSVVWSTRLSVAMKSTRRLVLHPPARQCRPSSGTTTNMHAQPTRHDPRLYGHALLASCVCVILSGSKNMSSIIAAVLITPNDTNRAANTYFRPDSAYHKAAFFPPGRFQRLTLSASRAPKRRLTVSLSYYSLIKPRFDVSISSGPDDEQRWPVVMMLGAPPSSSCSHNELTGFQRSPVLQRRRSTPNSTYTQSQSNYSYIKNK